MRLLYLVLLAVVCSATNATAQGRLMPFPDNGSTATIKFYPNPAVSYITFEDALKKYDKNYTIQLFNFLGKKVYEFSLSEQKNIVNISDFFRGIYIFQLRDPTGKIVESGKFQVTK
jgi:Secretion system C-terminal sorting domain